MDPYWCHNPSLPLPPIVYHKVVPSSYYWTDGRRPGNSHIVHYHYPPPPPPPPPPCHIELDKKVHQDIEKRMKKCTSLDSRGDLIKWVNYCLHSSYTQIKEMCSGAAYCQFIDMLFPGTVPLDKVNFGANFENEYRKNFKILQHTFQRLRIHKGIPVEALVRGYVQDNFEFLRWFKKFFLINYTGRPYNPLKARGWIFLGSNPLDQKSRRRHST